MSMSFTGPEFERALNEASGGSKSRIDERFGPGDTGRKIADLLADLDFEDIPVRKRWYS